MGSLNIAGVLLGEPPNRITPLTKHNNIHHAFPFLQMSLAPVQNKSEQQKLQLVNGLAQGFAPHPTFRSSLGYLEANFGMLGTKLWVLEVGMRGELCRIPCLATSTEPCPWLGAIVGLNPSAP